MPIDDSPRLNRRSWYNPDPHPDAIYVASRNYVINFSTPSYPPQVILLNYYNPNTDHTSMGDKPVHDTDKKGQ